MRILFMGTPEIAEKCLETLCDAGMDVAAVFTQPDRPKGRGMALTPPPVKVLAQRKGIAVYQPKKLRKSMDIIASIDPELIVVVAYGKILPKEVLDYPGYGCINLHASLLPRHRGASPIQAAILAGDTVGGVTTMYMSEELDAGNIIFAQETPIYDDDTGGTLHDRYADIGGKLLLKTIDAIGKGEAPSIPQNHALATFCSPIRKEDARIDWTRPSAEIRNLVRAYNPWPVAHTEIKGRELKIYSVKTGSQDRIPGSQPGDVLSAGDPGIEVATGDGSVYITELQTAGKRRMTAAEYLRGNSI